MMSRYLANPRREQLDQLLHEFGYQGDILPVDPFGF